MATRANAVPAFAQQTGEPCTTCHIGGFGPQLTPFGRAFKIGGYTQTGGEGLASKIPLSAFVISSFTNTQAGQPGGAAPHFGDNNNAAFDQVSVFLAGRITDYAGGFVQGTYSGSGPCVSSRQHRSSPDDPALTRRLRTAHRRVTEQRPDGTGRVQLDAGLDVSVRFLGPGTDTCRAAAACRRAWSAIRSA